MKGADIHGYPQPPAEDGTDAGGQESSQQEASADASTQLPEGAPSSDTDAAR